MNYHKLSGENIKAFHGRYKEKIMAVESRKRAVAVAMDLGGKSPVSFFFNIFRKCRQQRLFSDWLGKVIIHPGR